MIKNNKNKDQIWQIKKLMDDEIERKFQFYGLFKIKKIVMKIIWIKSERKTNWKAGLKICRVGRRKWREERKEWKNLLRKCGMEGPSWKFKYRRERWCLAIGQRCTCRSKSADEATIVCMNNIRHPLFNIKWYLKSAKISNCLWSNSIITKETMMKR